MINNQCNVPAVIKKINENHAVYEKLWKNIVQPDRSQMTIWRMHIACRIPKATNTHSEYVRNTYCSSNAKMVTRTLVCVTSYAIACLVILSDRYLYR